MKEEYLQLLERYKKATAWFKTASEERQAKFLPEFEKLICRMNELFNQLRASGVVFDGIEIWEANHG